MAMIPKQPSSITFLLFALVTLSFTTTSSADVETISVYWGQKKESIEGTLEDLCSNDNYNIVILQSLLVFDDSSTPQLNLADHCGTHDNPCSKLQPEIEYCQERNIKVFLSIGQDIALTLKPKNHRLKSNAAAAKALATYLLNNYLIGQIGPLGSVYLDGIDIADVADGVNLKWPEVVRAINASTSSRRIYLSASPQCVYPDHLLGNAINTGLFDYIWVEFFNHNPTCIYSDGSATNLLKAWTKWTSNVQKSSIFLGLAASDVIEGYIPPESLKSQVLPTAQRANNYGGVMIWDRASDIKSDYSGQIKYGVTKGCKCACDGDNSFASKSFYGLRSASMPLSI